MSVATPSSIDPDQDSGPFPDTAGEDDLWFLPGPSEDGAGASPFGPVNAPDEGDLIAAWRAAEAALARDLARVAMRLGALDDRLFRGPEGWRHRIALLAAVDLSRAVGERINGDRLALWIALRQGRADAEDQALAKAAWAFRRLVQGPGPMAGLAAFLGRHETARVELPPSEEGRLSDRLQGWEGMMVRAGHLSPLTRSCLAWALWPLAGIGPEGERLEAAVLAARLATGDAMGGLVAAPLGPGGSAMRASGLPERRLRFWLAGIEAGILATMRLIDSLEAWQARAASLLSDLSGQTPLRLITVLQAWPLVSAPMAESLTGASRAAIQRNLDILQSRDLIREVTGQNRFRFWATKM